MTKKKIDRIKVAQVILLLITIVFSAIFQFMYLARPNDTSKDYIPVTGFKASITRLTDIRTQKCTGTGLIAQYVFNGNPDVAPSFDNDSLEGDPLFIYNGQDFQLRRYDDDGGSMFDNLELRRCIIGLGPVDIADLSIEPMAGVLKIDAGTVASDTLLGPSTNATKDTDLSANPGWMTVSKTVTNTSSTTDKTMLIASISSLVSITALLGFFFTTILSWRREKRDAQSFELDIIKKDLEIQKLQAELKEKESKIIV